MVENAITAPGKLKDSFPVPVLSFSSLSHADRSQREKHALRLSRRSPYAGKLQPGYS